MRQLFVYLQHVFVVDSSPRYHHDMLVSAMQIEDRNYVQMIGSFIEQVQSTLREATLRRILTLAILLVIVFTGLLLFERLTGYFYLNSLEQRAAVLSELHRMSLDGIGENSDLAEIHETLAVDVVEYDSWSRSIGQLALEPVSFPATLLKFIAGGAFWVFFAIVGLVTNREHARSVEDHLRPTAIAFLLACTFGIPTALVPALSAAAYIFYALAQVLLIVSLLLIASGRPKEPFHRG